MKRTSLCILMAASLSAAASVTAWADAIPVYGTGVDGSGNLLSGGSLDPHWTITGGVLGATSAYVYDGGYPIGVWAANGPSSMWISPTSNTSDFGGPTYGPVGDYVYQTTFDLTGLDATTAQLSGDWATDDEATAFLNGNYIGSLPFATLGSFSVTDSADFVAGVNTLLIDVYNSGGPTGLRVDISGTANSAAPEPGTWFSLVLGMGGVAALKLRRTAR